VFNEIMYNSSTPESTFVEILNRSPAFAFDLSGWRVNGLNFTFKPGALIFPGQYMVLAKNAPALASSFGSAPPAFASFDGQLDDGGETLTLIKPGATPEDPEIVVDKVKYDDDRPWPAAADGAGPSLQLLDSAEDNARVSNWTDGQGWRYYTYTGTVQGPPLTRAANFFVYFVNAGGEVFIDDIKLVAGSVPEVGPNLLVNGDFEAPLAGTWAALGNHSNSVQSTEVSHSGTASLKLSATGGGNTSASFVRQFITGPDSNAIHTVSFWFLPSTNGNQIKMAVAW